MPVRERVGRYRLRRKLGEGGMGVVFEAEDESLGRLVALKLIGDDVRDEEARQRFRREARLAASVAHPNVCTVHEVGEDAGELYIAMELLQGEPLSARLARGPLSREEAVRVSLGVLAGLEALHARGLVHRDVKPANVFLTPHGVKLVDFGLARASAGGASAEAATATQLTEAGRIVGTPHYMSPEQLRGEALDARSDLFSAGAMLFEMLAGRRAFDGATRIDVFHATLHDAPPPLSGASKALDPVVRRALAKRADERPSSAAAMAKEISDAAGADAERQQPGAGPTRLIVLPLRVLRADPETDFLAVSLPDAVASSLAGLGSLTVRSSLVAARYADAPDLARIAAEADVDLVLSGTLLRAGDRVRVQCQLAHAPEGTILWSHAAQVALTDVFGLEEELGRRIVESIAQPLTLREHRELKRDVPASALAYELTLRAAQVELGVNAVQGPRGSLPIARDLYLRAVQEDPRYAPAWARLGRVYRLLAKTGESSARNFELAEEAFAKALSLNPDLPSTHYLYAALECDRGRAADALVRLVRRASAFPNDPQLFAGLVHACRYAGLLGASLAAHARAVRLDPNAATSVAHTLFMRLELAESLAAPGQNALHRATVLALMGREEEARALVPPITQETQPLTALYWTSFAAVLDRRPEEGRAAAEERIEKVQDPEARFHSVRHLARMGEGARALAEVERLFASDYLCADFVAADPWMESVRREPRYDAVLAAGRRRASEVRSLFAAAGGEALLPV